MDRKEREKLQEEAQEKLSKAWELIDEAGKLAKKGQFVLEFGEVGTFIPKRYSDPELYREDALEELKAEGWNRWNSKTGKYDIITWAELEADEELMKSAVDHKIESIIDSLDIPSEFREYDDDGEGTDCWWTPSRC